MTRLGAAWRARHRPLIAAVLAMQAVLTMGSMASFSAAVLAPEATREMGVASSSLGIFVAVMYMAAMLSGLLTGASVARYGPIRVSQAAMLSSAAALALLAAANLPAALLAAVLLGAAYGTLNPAAAPVLMRDASDRDRPLVFSIKQTGVPLGGMLSGALLPALAIAFGWQAGLLGVALVALAVMLGIQPLRADHDAARRRDAPLRIGHMLGLLRRVWREPLLRNLSMVGFCFAACQVCAGTFFVVYLTGEGGFSLVDAGLAFAAMQFGGIVGRVLWGALAERFVRPSTLLVWLAVIMACAFVAEAAIAPHWPLWLVVALAFVIGAAAFGWNGVYLAEVARLAPRGEMEDITGAMQFVYFGGVVLVPSLFGAAAGALGGYSVPLLALTLLDVAIIARICMGLEGKTDAQAC